MGKFAEKNGNEKQIRIVYITVGERKKVIYISMETKGILQVYTNWFIHNIRLKAILSTSLTPASYRYVNAIC